MSNCDKITDEDFIELDKKLKEDFASPTLPITADDGTGRRIKLNWYVSRYNYHATDGIRVRIEASNANLMPNKVFAYLLLPLRPGDNERVGAFDHVCSPTDLEEYPEDEPIPTIRPEWFRLDYVDVVLRSRTEVYAFIRDVAADVYNLRETLNITDRIMPAGEIWFGGDPLESSSSSAAESSSSESSDG
jgi:hypothetical protein